MAKAKRFIKAKSDAVCAKKSAKAANPFEDNTNKKINPFEVHLNKEKFKILGRTCKHDKGLPGVSRAKANKKRKETLEQEYKQKHKNNKFLDRRIGRHLNGEQLTDDVLNARLVADKVLQMKQNKISRFVLNDDEVLTHRGQTLEEIEQFRDERSDDEDEENQTLDAEFTEKAHFGGLGEERDRKSVIADMIEEQKRKKIEIAKEKDEVHNLTEKLDSNYKELMQVVGKLSKDEVKAKSRPDDYDKIMREMIFEPRGAVTDKLLSEEEIAQKEKERLQELEEERRKRMLPEEETTTKKSHRSADDLDDSYFGFVESAPEKMLAYTKEGQLQQENNKENDGNEGENNEEEENDEEEEENEEENNEEENEEEEEDDDDNSEELDIVDLKNSVKIENSDEEQDSSADDLDDLKLEESESEEEENQEREIVKRKSNKKAGNEEKSSKSIFFKDLPFSLEMPKNYSKFCTLMAEYALEERGIIIERLIKCHHPKLNGVNQGDVLKLFSFLLDYINEQFYNANIANIKATFKLLHFINPHLYDLFHLNPVKMSGTFLKIIQTKYEEYKKKAKFFPNLETIVLFKLVSNHFSTSDFRNYLATPTFIFLQHVLTNARVKNCRDVAIGLFLVSISVEYTQISQRYFPAALNFLQAIIYLSVPKRPLELPKKIPPFHFQGLLAIDEDEAKEKRVEALLEQQLKSEDFMTINISAEFKVRALNISLKLIKIIATNLQDKVGVNYVASDFLNLLNKLSLELYPKYVQENLASVMELLQKLESKPLKKLVPPEQKPKALRLLEPRIETVYDDKRRPKLTEKQEERVKLLHKVKRETKGAKREIRRDTQFLQKIRIQQQIQSDMERKEKVKRIYQEASMQQGELNELERAKKRKKF